MQIAPNPDMVQRHGHRTVEFPERRDCLVAVASDTHGKPHPNLFALLKEHRPSLILHAGDVGGREVLDRLEKLSTMVYVRGNVDPSGPVWPDSLSVSLRIGAEIQINLLLLHIAFVRLRLNRTALDLLRHYPAQTVVFGHSHVPFVGMEGNVALFNPGSAGPARWGLPTTLGFMEIALGRVTFRHLDLRTGKDWKPGTRQADLVQGA